MSEDSAHADHPQEGQEFLLPGFNPTSAPSSPSHTLPRLGTKTLTSPTSSGGQVSAITVVALLDKLVAMIEAVQENQRRMEKRQAELEGTVRGVQGDVARLAKSHSTTATGVSKLLERSRKTGGYIKDVRERLERQGNQVKRLEANHAHLLKRNHFKVLIFQVSCQEGCLCGYSQITCKFDKNTFSVMSPVADTVSCLIAPVILEKMKPKLYVKHRFLVHERQFRSVNYSDKCQIYLNK
uniref:Caveolae associated protein 2a n=1 Tax=Astyanax mexicanus TaxID=7994 RepID=A0A3B1JKB0_ASTMX